MGKVFHKDIPEFLGFEYLTLKNAPIKRTKHGDVIDLPDRQLELIAAKAIILNGIPLRGKEVKLLRSVLDLSLEKFARHLDLSAATILKWEKAPLEALSTPNELAARLFVAEMLHLSLPSNKFSELKSKSAPTELICTAA